MENLNKIVGDNVNTINKSFDEIRTWKNNMDQTTATKSELNKMKTDIQDTMNKHQVETATKVDGLMKDISDKMQDTMQNVAKPT